LNCTLSFDNEIDSTANQILACGDNLIQVLNE